MFTVSWASNEGCGNQSFATIAELDLFIGENAYKWRSFSRWKVVDEGHGISRLEPLQES